MAGETEAMRQKMLSVVNKPLIFSGFTLYSLPGFSDTMLFRGEASVYGTDAQKFTFQVSAADVKLHSVVRGNSFTYSDFATVFTFKITDINPDLEGMKILTCDLIGMVNA